jgi:hypothetical protein
MPIKHNIGALKSKPRKVLGLIPVELSDIEKLKLKSSTFIAQN